MMKPQDLTTTWVNVLDILFAYGREVSPRGMKTKELSQYTVRVDMMRPVLLDPTRKLSYRFMAAEAYWILTGDNKVETIVPWNQHIAKFSDDGEVFAGAYGPRIMAQIDYVINKLIEDIDTRQAGLTIWHPNPAPSKDIPCTVALWFQVRDLKLNVHVFMRSSDVWLGLPYDIFNFAMLGHYVCAEIRRRKGMLMLEPGEVLLTAASMHLYETNWQAAQEVIRNLGSAMLIDDKSRTPEGFYMDSWHLLNQLHLLRDSSPGDVIRWWEHANNS